MEIKEIKYLGEQAVSYLIEKCKATFALITHTHTAEEVGADASGSAAAALALANENMTTALNNYYTKTEIDELELITVDDIDTICGTTIATVSEVNS